MFGVVNKLIMETVVYVKIRMVWIRIVIIHKKFAIIICNEFYEKLRENSEAQSMIDLPWVKNDLLNARSTV